MYYVPAKVTNWTEWTEKWLSQWIVMIIPGVDIFWIFNLWLMWTYDGFWLFFTEPRYKWFPSFYTNWMAKSVFTNELWGPFKYYDMFTLDGVT
jgi:hypothetical protein